MAFCSKCGMQLSEKGKFCENCGAPLGQTYAGDFAGNRYSPPVKTPTQTLAQREQICAIVWTVVAAIQGLIGLTDLAVSGGLMWFDSVLSELIGYNMGFDLSWNTLLTLGLAAFNGYGAYCSFQRVARVRMRQRGIVAEYDGTLTTSIVAIVANVLFGSIVGVAGGVFDLFNRNYALSNAKYLEN